MIEKGEKRFVWIHRLIKVFLPLAVLLMLIDYIVFTKGQITRTLVAVYGVKILLIMFLGLLEGTLEWKFYQYIFGPSVTTLKDLRKRYIINNGVLAFGLPLGIINFRVYSSHFMIEYIRLSIWLIVGVFFGGFLWAKNKAVFERTINKK